MLRESISAKAIAKEYGLDAKEVQAWKTSFLKQLKTATKGTPPRKNAPPRPTPAPMVEDISQKRIRKEDAKRPPQESPVVPFPDQPGSQPLTAADRQNLEKTHRLIIEKGQVAEVGKKLGMMPRHHYEAPRPGPISQAGEPGTAEGPGMHELADDTKERFAKNWAKVGADTPPLAQQQLPPPPMVPSFKERLSTRLASLPVISWVLHGGRLRSPWLVPIILLTIGGVVYLLLKDWETYRRQDSLSAEELKETPRYLQPISRAEVESSEKLIRDFFAVRTIDGLEPYVRMPGTILPLMRRYYLIRAVKPLEVKGFDYHRRSDISAGDITIHGARLGRLGKVREITIEHTPNGPKIDWETAVRYQPMEWQNFRRVRPTETTYFRLSLQRSTYYEKPFHDMTVYQSYRIIYPGELRPLNGFVMIDTEAEIAMRSLFKDTSVTKDLIVGLKFRSSAKTGDGLVEITELLQDSWIMSHGEGEQHIDLRIPESRTLPKLPPEPAVPDPETAPSEVLEAEESEEPAAETPSEAAPPKE